MSYLKKLVDALISKSLQLSATEMRSQQEYEKMRKFKTRIISIFGQIESVDGQ